MDPTTVTTAVRAIQGGLIDDVVGRYYVSVDSATDRATAFEAVDRLEALLSLRLDWRAIADVANALASTPPASYPTGSIGLLAVAEVALRYRSEVERAA